MTTDSSRLRKTSKFGKDITRVLLIVAVFVLVALLLRDPHVREHLFNIQRIRDDFHADETLFGRLLAYLVFILVSSPLIALGLPRVWVSIVAGSIFGVVIGVPVALIASLVGATGTYLIGRSLLASMIRRRFGRRIKLWRERFRENAFLWTLYPRLFPLANATLTSLICGTCKVNLRAYLAASAIGFLPLTIVFAVFGSGAAKSSALQIGLGSVLFLATVLLQRTLAPKLKRARARSRTSREKA